MSSPLAIAQDHVVLFEYVLKDDDGAVLDASQGHPMAYLHGHHNIVPGLEKELEGKVAGDSLSVRVSPEEGYGPFEEGKSEQVHRREFPKDMELRVGMPIRAEGSDGQVMVLWIEKIQGAQVTITVNHPLAGKHLNFDIEVTSVREASAEEIAHGHVHGPGGHHH